MDANQRSETNNQTNNGANEKWTEGSKGNTTSGPNDHTYPNSATMQQAQPGMEPAGGRDLHGGSMQSQQTGGSGAQQGITDSHQRQMEIHSEAWGLLEQPVGRHSKNAGVDVHPHPGNSQSAQDMNPQNVAHPELQGGSLGHHHPHYDAPQVVGESPVHTAEADMSATPHEELYGRHEEGSHVPRSAMGMDPRNVQSGAGAQQSSQSQPSSQLQQSSQSQPSSQLQQSSQSQQASPSQQPSQSQQPGSMQSGSGQSAQGGDGNEQHGGGHSQYSADRDGSQTGEHARDTGTEDVHLSNDVSGGLPRSPGNSGPRSDNPGWKPGGSMQRDPAVHESNDTIGGLPRSPAGANQLAGDRKMDDDTGFSRK